MRTFLPPFFRSAVAGACGVLLGASLLVLAPARAAPAHAEVVSGTTDWLFASSYADGGSYDHPENALRRDGVTAYADQIGYLTLRGFAPVDLPWGAAIDKVELRYHMSGERASVGFLQTFPTYQQCEDHTYPGHVKDIVPTVFDDYVVEYTDQDCRIPADNVRHGKYEVWLVRYVGTDAHFTIDDISVRFSYTARTAAVDTTNPQVGTPVTATYTCPQAPNYSVLQSNGQPADGVTIAPPVAGQNAAYTQVFTMANSGQYVIHIDCAGVDIVSPLITVTDPTEDVTDWLFASTAADGGAYDNRDNALVRDGVVAHSDVGGRLTLRDFQPVALPEGTTVRKVEIRSHLGGGTYLAVHFGQYIPSYNECADHNSPSGATLQFLPFSDAVLSDYVVNYTELDCGIRPENVRTGAYDVTLQSYFSGYTFNIDDVSVRFTYTTPAAPVTVTPASALAGSTFSATYECGTAPTLSVQAADGTPAGGVTLSAPVTSDQRHYTQDMRLALPGTYTVHVLCGSREAVSGHITVFRPLTYVALGDSYSSGEGNPGYDLSAPCHRSSAAWPARLAQANAERITNTLNLACTGATTAALTDRYKGQPPQLAVLGPVRPDIVTVTIGGNDIDFAGVLRSCYMWRCNHQLDAASVDINNLVQGLPSHYASIRSAAPPGAQVVVVGYPRLFPSTQGETNGCGWLEESERTKLNQLAAQLDEGMAGAAGLAGVRFVSTLDTMTGHELCTTGSWLNPIQPNPLDSAAAHPNAQGQQAIAAAVNTALAL